MLATGLMQDLSFSDLGRLLQQTTTTHDTTLVDGSDEEIEEGRDEDSVFAVYLFGFIMVVIMTIGCYKWRINASHVPELPSENKPVRNTTKSTLAERKQAIIELFDTSDVTMVSVHDAHCWCWQGIRISHSRK
jgi:hypothetical protein